MGLGEGEGDVEGERGAETERVYVREEAVPDLDSVKEREGGVAVRGAVSEKEAEAVGGVGVCERVGDVV